MSNSCAREWTIHSLVCLLHAFARRCVFESSASSELLVRLRAYPKMWEALEALPHKVLALSSSEPSKPVELPAEESLETRVDDVTARIQQATFTGKGDKETVIAMYKDYVARIATALQKTLALASAAAPSKFALPLPHVAVQAASPVRFAPGQLLLMLQAGDADRAAGSVGGTRIGVVSEDGRVSLTMAGDYAALSKTIVWSGQSASFYGAHIKRSSKTSCSWALRWERIQTTTKFGSSTSSQRGL